MEHDANAVLLQCLDWERSLPHVSKPAPAAKVEDSANAGATAGLAKRSEEAREKARSAALSAVSRLMKPAGASAPSLRRQLPSDHALTLANAALAERGTAAAAAAAPKAFDVDAKLSSAAADAAAAGRLPRSTASAEDTAASGDAAPRVAGRQDAKPSKAQRQAANMARKAEGWYGISAGRVDQATKRDIEALRSRQWLDPKRFYKTKGEDKDVASRMQYFHRGTVVAGSMDRKSSTIARKQRPKSLVESLLSDARVDRFTRKTMAAAKRDAARSGSGAARRRAKRALEGPKSSSEPRRRRLKQQP
ncbi:hypothetical protein FNF27_07662 [Cafeteria roenbergensis]|uniref:Fcf2 pre-rRNA processing C-terminal domain-containing protein n=1 Tax=Cafeteria roenbergensis TaxID=33653 RepID=A0A5A8CF40_CAFRO|nr:hypothetical protein FNF29_07979 [Cafeteria roenbergensis]KAA0151626.1 hypothetical protein FNF31_06795 [Cafeteria roenbergensis]KAA0152682.1 hypothetical protein FNF28_07011 [Cafeteria roenbergensis]KAA0165379.1 hypothetical protein FNF27_07662 [Cafeteria roenbergensis]|eukprot:KAA0146572.1 hypothetical protein FNF29_07979 [Cafeteria roenbergensis]